MKPFLSQYETTWILPILGQIHGYNNTFELGILFSVVGVIVTVMLSLSGGRLMNSNIITSYRFLVFIGTYMILSINLIRIVIGISIYTHAGNLIIMSMGTYGSSRSEPLITWWKPIVCWIPCYKLLY